MSDRDNDIRILTELCGFRYWYIQHSGVWTIFSPDVTDFGQWTPWPCDDVKPVAHLFADLSSEPVPRLSESLDACMEFIIPAMSARDVHLELRNHIALDGETFQWAVVFHGQARNFVGEGRTAARAIVAAVCAYLDGEGK